MADQSPDFKKVSREIVDRALERLKTVPSGDPALDITERGPEFDAMAEEVEVCLKENFEKKQVTKDQFEHT